jgi:hypothetical protein
MDDVLVEGSSQYSVIVLLLATVIAFLIASVLSRSTKIRFSLRTLLLATTAVAVVLGLIIYATRG